MTMLMTSLILGAAAAPMSEADFQARFRAALDDMSSPIVLVEEETIKGVIASSDEEAKSFTLTDEADGSHAFTWNEKTEWMLNGEKATRKDVLISGYHAEVKHDENGVALSVSAKTE